MGQYVRNWEQRHLDILTTDIFGFHAVQLGLPQLDTLQANRMPYRWVADVMGAGQEGYAAAQLPLVVLDDFAALPFASQSLDLVVLPHVLEFSANPHQVLREVERVLMPEGQVIICGFNPASLWGLRQMAGRLTGNYVLPGAGELMSVPRLRDWLKLLNMEVNRGYFGCYAPPFKTTKWLQQCDFMEKAGDRWWPYFGATYIVQAVKRVQGMHLIGPALTTRKAVVPKGVPVANRVQKTD